MGVDPEDVRDGERVGVSSTVEGLGGAVNTGTKTGKDPQGTVSVNLVTRGDDGRGGLEVGLFTHTRHRDLR